MEQSRGINRWLGLGLLLLVLASCGGGGGSGGTGQPDDGGDPGSPPGQGDPDPEPEPEPEPEPVYFDPEWRNEPLPAAPLEAPRGQWLTTDTHVHTDHSSDGSMWRQASDDALPGNVAVADQIGQAVRQDLDFLTLTDHRTYDQHWDPLWTSGDLLLIPGEEANGRPHANILGAVDTVLDGMDGAEGAEHRPTQQSLWDAHGQGAVWQSNHPDRDWSDDDGTPNDHASLIGGDLIEVWNIAQDKDAQLAYAESRWNLGMETGVTASSDNHFRELWLGFGPGTVKTHVFAPVVTERAILGALRHGHTVLSQGGALAPFLTLRADAQGDGVFEALPGDAVVAAAGQPVTLRMRVQRGLAHRLRLYAAPGRDAGPLATFRPSSSDDTFVTTVSRPEGDAPYWVYAEVTDLLGVRKALTSPIFLRASDAGGVPQGERAVPASLQWRDGAALVVGERGAFSGFADVAETAEGVPLVVAERHDAEGTDILFRRGDQAEPVVLNTLAGAARFPRVAAGGGSVWVVWEDERRGQQPRRPRIILRGSTDGGLTWEPEVLLSATEGRAIRPALAVLADGRPVVAWSDNARRCFDLMVQIGADGAAESLSSDKVCDGGHALDTRSTRDPSSLHPALTVLADDTVVVAFQDNRFDVNPGWTGQTGFYDGLEGLDRTDPDNWEIVTRRRDPDTGVWSPLVRVSNNGSPDDAFIETALADRHPSLAADGGGRLIAAWDAKVLRSAGVNSAILASVSEDGGLSWSEPVPVGSNDQAMSQRPTLAVRGDGAIQAVWMDTRDSDWRHRLWGSRWRAETGWSPARRLSGTGNAVWPRAAGDQVVFASDRGGLAQRDPTWRVFHRLTGSAVGETPSLLTGTRSVTSDTLANWRRRWLDRARAMPSPETQDHDHPHPH
ncbi:CehA/McbA family metallohydrolase [Alloalcanivorax xenomutans]|uniref:CehA/McbA family metallohydrolase n=1 Tax=Alloalcanivorax xenomutans TaxID=1094342 RepID=UPI003BA9B901